MLPTRVSRDDEGSAAVEFIVVGVVLLVPLFYLVLVLGQVQGHALGVESGARHVARSVASAAGESDAAARADRVLAAITAEYGLGDEVVVEISCLPVGGECPRAGALVRVVMRADAALPFVPPVFGLDRAARVPVEAVSVQRVSRMWGVRDER